MPVIRAEHVDVHVGEAGNHEAPAAVDDLRTFGCRRVVRGTGARDAIAIDHDRGVGERRAAGAVDQRGTGPVIAIERRRLASLMDARIIA